MPTNHFYRFVFAALIVGAGFINSSGAQELDVEVIDQNGQSVNPRVIVGRNHDQDAAASAQAQGGGSARGQGAGSVNGSGGVSVTNDNGKITITDAEGSERVIDLPGARGVTVTQSEKTIVRDGQTVTESVGKAIIIGPDGQRHEIDLSGPGNWTSKLPAAYNVQKNAAGKFIIGVNCAPISETLTAQLKLASDIGLVVESVSLDSPAASAGLEQHDILLYADDSDLKSVDDLVAAIELAGKQSRAVSLTVLRAGKESGVDVTPTARPAHSKLGVIIGENVKPGADGLLKLNVEDLDGLGFDFQQAGPGVIIGSDFGADYEDLKQQMHDQMEEMRAEMENMKKMFQEQQPDQ